MALFQDDDIVKKIHIMNIGHPRCGTTWLWRNLKKHPYMADVVYEKENQILHQAYNMQNYIDFYSRFNYSANFNPNSYMIDRNLISFLSPYLSHVTWVVRNPYDFIQRYYDYIGSNTTHTEFIDWALEFRIIDYHLIWQRWNDRLDKKSKIKVFFFDDLKNRPEWFLTEYFTFCDLPVTLDEQFATPRNVSTKTTQTIIDFTDYQSRINQKIELFMKQIDVDLTGWLK